MKHSSSTVLTTTKTFDTLDRLSGVSSVPATGTGSSFQYRYNAAGLRDLVTLTDASHWSIGYNDRGEVTSGERRTSGETVFPGQSFGYGFDAIGNRLTATANGRTSTYAPNNLNQYTSRTVPGYLDILGEAASDASVTVNGQSAERLGSYFRAEVAVDNTTAPVWQSTSVTATRGTTTVTTDGHRFVPQTPESFGHDDDGNLTSDGRWDNIWDGENRLVSQTTSASAVAAGAPRQKLAYAYDYAGRRIHKTLSTWNGSRYVRTYGLLFLYDGWNLVAEVSDNGGPMLRGYAWGSDLSGGTAAGGIGGLVFIHQGPEDVTLAVAADAQGNTSALYDMADASLAASYEYGPFGEPLRVSGKFGDANPIRWSTKYQDWETGWVNYIYRPYIPRLGRWASQDPIGEAGGLNVLGFCLNNPVSLVDPLGLLTHAESMNWLNTNISKIRASSGGNENIVRATVGSIYVELRRQELTDAIVDASAAATYVNLAIPVNSYGPGQIKPIFAEKVISGDKGSFTDITASAGKDYRRQVLEIILNDPGRLANSAFKQIISQWDEAREQNPDIFDIAYRPDLLATLYNLGLDKSIPKENPMSGGSKITLDGRTQRFGEWAKEFLNSPDGKKLLEKLQLNSVPCR